MSILNKLTEGIVNRSLRKEGDALLGKWEKTGLLEGLDNSSKRSGMARLLENQAKELLREASSMAAGDVEGFAAVAFPIVRRVFAGLIANDLVSVQPMSLPSGLIFFLDFQYSEQTSARLGINPTGSVYGGGVVAAGLTGGVTDLTEASGGFYNLANAYSSPTGSLATGTGSAAGQVIPALETTVHAAAGTAISSLDDEAKRSLRYDVDVLNGGASTDLIHAVTVTLVAADMAKINKDALSMCTFMTAPASGSGPTASTIIDGNGDEGHVIRRLTHLGTLTSTGNPSDATAKATTMTLYLRGGTGFNALGSLDKVNFVFPLKDSFEAANALGAVVGTDTWGLEEGGVNQAAGAGAASTTGKNQIPEIDIKVDSVAVTAVTKKLKAKWTPELGQDLNAYHNLDAEVELTSILSEHIALEIDREILNDLVTGATAGRFYWSRAPGLFVNKTSGAELGASSAAPDFTGTVSEWYETLVETINDVSAQIHRKTLRGGATFLVTSPEVANILEFTSGFRANITHDDDRGTVGAVKSGNLSKKWDVFVDPYFPRNLVLVGRKGGSFLESGYVYAPYVPLQVTPTIFGPEDFVPRKGVMTRYAKKMVRPDMYGLVVVRGLLGEAGATS